MFKSGIEAIKSGKTKRFTKALSRKEIIYLKKL